MLHCRIAGNEAICLFAEEAVGEGTHIQCWAGVCRPLRVPA